MISHDVYKEIRKRRIKTGTDWLKDNNWDGAKAYEQQLLNDRNYSEEDQICEKLLELN